MVLTLSTCIFILFLFVAYIKYMVYYKCKNYKKQYKVREVLN